MQRPGVAAEIGRMCAGARQDTFGRVIDAALTLAGGVPDGLLGQVGDDWDLQHDEFAAPGLG